jgi:hypothetical protein
MIEINVNVFWVFVNHSSEGGYPLNRSCIEFAQCQTQKKP